MSELLPAGSRPHIAIVGLMGAGKSTLADSLASALGVPTGDSDRDIETLTGLHSAEYAAANGVAALHRLETAVLLGRLALPDRAIVSAGASTVEQPECRTALDRRSRVLWLDVEIDLLLARLSRGGHRRPMWGEEARLLAERRRPLFESVADLMLDAREPPATLLDQALAFLQR